MNPEQVLQMKTSSDVPDDENVSLLDSYLVLYALQVAPQIASASRGYHWGAITAPQSPDDIFASSFEEVIVQQRR
jgi:hypothetical protein